MLYCVVAVECRDCAKCTSCRGAGTMRIDDARQSILEELGQPVPSWKNLIYQKRDSRLPCYSGRHEAPFTFEKTRARGDSTLGHEQAHRFPSLVREKGFAPSPDEFQFLYVFTSFMASIVEHGCIDMHAKLQASTDGLTGIANHRSFHESLAREIARADRGGTTFGSCSWTSTISKKSTTRTATSWETR